MNGNKVNSPPPVKGTNNMMYVVIAVVVIVVLGLIGYGIYSAVSNSKVKSGDTNVTGNSNILGENTLDDGKYHFKTNNDTGDVEITKDGQEQPLWKSETSGYKGVSWRIDTDGVFRIYTMLDSGTWRSAKAAIVTDKSLIGEENGLYTYTFKNGVFSVLNKNSKLVWDTKNGNMIIDISKKVEPSLKTTKEVNNNSTGNVDIELSASD